MELCGCSQNLARLQAVILKILFKDDTGINASGDEGETGKDSRDMWLQMH